MSTFIILVSVAAAIGVGLVVFGIVRSQTSGYGEPVRASYRTLTDVREQLRRRFEPTGTPVWIASEQRSSRLPVPPAAPALPAARPQASIPKADSLPWTVQLAAYARLDKALALADRLLAAGMPAFVTPIALPGDVLPGTYAVMARLGFGWVDPPETTIQARPPSRREAEMFGLGAGVALHEVRRVRRTEEGRAVAVTVKIMPGDRNVIVFN